MHHSGIHPAVGAFPAKRAQFHTRISTGTAALSRRFRYLIHPAGTIPLCAEEAGLLGCMACGEHNELCAIHIGRAGIHAAGLPRIPCPRFLWIYNVAQKNERGTRLKLEI